MTAGQWRVRRAEPSPGKNALARLHQQRAPGGALQVSLAWTKGERVYGEGMLLADLPDQAHLRVIASDPALTVDLGAHLAMAIDKLFLQFQREGRVVAWASEIQVHGALLLLAWTGAPLSGCSHDKIGGLLAAWSARSGCRLLDAPPIVVETGAGVRCTDRAGLRALVTAGAVDADSAIWLRSASTLGQWRGEAGRRLGESPLAAMAFSPPQD